MDSKTQLTRRSYQLSIDAIKTLECLHRNFINQVLARQLLRSITSIGANIVEAKAASSRLDFKKYHEIALKSANESKYWLCLIRDTKRVPKEQVEPLLQEVIEISNMLASGIIKLKAKTGDEKKNGNT